MKLIEEYRTAISEFVKATKEGKILWKKQNPTTLFMESVTIEMKALVSLQKVITKGAPIIQTNMAQRIVRRPDVINYVFSVKSNNDAVVQIDTTVEPDLKGALSELFDVCELSLEEKNIGFLKDIIGGITKKGA